MVEWNKWIPSDQCFLICFSKFQNTKVHSDKWKLYLDVYISKETLNSTGLKFLSEVKSI
jgi:hypothetical protein